jgi:hypothetical protein
MLQRERERDRHAESGNNKEADHWRNESLKLGQGLALVDLDTLREVLLIDQIEADFDRALLRFPFPQKWRSPAGVQLLEVQRGALAAEGTVRPPAASADWRVVMGKPTKYGSLP